MMIKTQNLKIKKLIEYKKDLKEKVNKVTAYNLPDIEWIKEDKEKEISNLVPKSLGWSMKVIEKKISGKTKFVSAFLEFLVYYIEGVKNIYYYL